jgi:hypothetical protein
MGQLHTLKHLEDTGMLPWYCPHGMAIVDNRCPVFKYECSIHIKLMDDTYDYENRNRLKGEIRQFVEHVLSDTVIMAYLGLGYYHKPKIKGRPYSDYGYSVSHGYYRFFFESEASQVAFALKFSEHITTKMRWKDDALEYGEHNMEWNYSNDYPRRDTDAYPY